jgi:hypothetical protein
VNNTPFTAVQLKHMHQPITKAFSVQLYVLGYPVAGDQRYGTAGNRMGLHTLRLKIVNPKTGKELIFKTPAPVDFFALMNQQHASL